MSFTPFTFKKKSFAIVDAVNTVMVDEKETKVMVLTGKTGVIEIAVGKEPVEIGQTVYLDKKDEKWVLSLVEKTVKKSTKGNPDFTYEERRAFMQMNG